MQTQEQGADAARLGDSDTPPGSGARGGYQRTTLRGMTLREIAEPGLSARLSIKFLVSGLNNRLRCTFLAIAQQECVDLGRLNPWILSHAPVDGEQPACYPSLVC